MRLPPLLLAVAALLLLVGCGSTRTDTYQVAVVNETERPVMLWLTKSGPPAEGGWLTPSQWLQLREDALMPADTPTPAVELPPSTRADIGPQRGEFEPESEAVLLVYATPVTLAEMAATPRGGSLMDVVFLEPGPNYVRGRSASPVRAERVSRLVGRPASTTSPTAGPRP